MLILLLEAGLRIFLAAPRGIFTGLLPGANGLYPASASIEMIWAPIPYRVTTNSLGFRGPELRSADSRDGLRIAAIGDSVTDGFFVDDEATYPHQLRVALSDRRVPAEVVNAARGGGSIGKELAILREAVLPLAPDIVLLTFVTNDVSDIRGVARDELVAAELPAGRVPPTLWMMTRTAVGEVGYDLYLRAASESYRRKRAAGVAGAERYAIAGGGDFAQNAALFLERYAGFDGLVLADRFTPEAEALAENYLFALDRFLALCAERQIQAGLIYFPAYPEIYGPPLSPRMRQRLAEAARSRAVPFLDLTPAFRREGRSRVLHLAPLDFHLNPAGYSVMATAVADFVVDALIPRVGAGREAARE